MADVQLRAGDVITHGGSQYIVIRTSDAGAMIAPLNKTTRVIVDRLKDKTAEISVRGIAFTVSARTSSSIVVKRGHPIPEIWKAFAENMEKHAAAFERVANGRQ